MWSVDVGGLFAALGVGSIVIGLALQNAVGGIVSGLLLLSEQPFQVGDWLLVNGTKGRGRRGQLAGDPPLDLATATSSSRTRRWPRRRS